MHFSKALAAAVGGLGLVAGAAQADMQGTGDSGGWEKRVAIEPDPSKVVVPDGYEVGIFAKGLSAPSAATVDGDGNLWVAVSPPLLGSPDQEEFDDPHVKVFNPAGELIKEVGLGTFTSVMNELSYCPENGKTYIPNTARRSGRSTASTASSSSSSKTSSSATTRTAASPAGAGTSISPSGSPPTPALRTPTTTAGPTSRTTRSGPSTTPKAGARRPATRRAARSSIRASTCCPLTGG